MTAGLSGGEQRRVKDLVDAFNAVKQDLLAARYLLWLASGEESPIREHAAAMSQRAGFLDSLMYARWGVRTGIAVQAFAAATNVLDKVACLVHLYYRTRRKTTAVSFRYLWHRRTPKNKPDVMDPEMSDQFADGRGNRGLMALCDLSCDLEIESPLNELVERRHTATHRFLTVHSMLLDSEETDTRWLDRVGWYELTEGAMWLLSTARAAIIYLARTIDIAEQAAAEHRNEGADGTGRLGFPTMPLFRASTEHPDFE